MPPSPKALCRIYTVWFIRMGLFYLIVMARNLDATHVAGAVHNEETDRVTMRYENPDGIQEISGEVVEKPTGVIGAAVIRSDACPRQFDADYKIVGKGIVKLRSTLKPESWGRVGYLTGVEAE